MPGRDAILAASFAASLLGAMPIRLMPVSRARWILAVRPLSFARQDNSLASFKRNIAGVILYCKSSSNRCLWVTPKIRIGFWIPWWRRLIPSSILDTA